MIDVAPDIDEILEIAAEDSVIDTCLSSQSLHLAISVSHHHLLVGSAMRIRSEIRVARLLVEAIDTLHHIAVIHDLSQQLSVQVIEIEVVIAVALTGQKDMIVSQLDILQHLFLDIFVYLVLHSQLADSRQRVSHIDAQHILMTVHRHDGHLRRIACGLDTGDIAVGIQRHIDLARLMRLDIIAEHTDLRVHLSRHRILIGIVAWVLRIVAELGIQPLEQLHGVLLDGAFVITDPYDLPRIGREDHRATGRELLFIDPVGYAVDNLVLLSVSSHLTLCVVIEQLHQIDVILPDKGNLITVGREDGRLLGPAVTQRLQLVVPDAVDIIGGRERVAVNRLRVSLDQHPRAVRTQDIVVHLVDPRPSGCGGIEEHTLQLACTEGAYLHPFAVIAHLSVGLPVCHRAHFLHRLGTELPTGDTRQAQLLTCEGAGKASRCQYCQDR